MDIVIRPAQPTEYERVGELTAEAYLADGFVRVGDDYLNRLRDARHRAEHAQLLVAEDTVRGELVGSVAFVLGDSIYAEVARAGEVEFRMLSVAPQARGRGVGEALVRSCLALAQRAGAHGVVISSNTMMRTAHRLYERLGFVRCPERDWSPIPEVSLIGYQRSLS